MSNYSVLDNWELNGTNYEDFKDAMNDIDRRTVCSPVTYADICFLNHIDESELADGVTFKKSASENDDEVSVHFVICDRGTQKLTGGSPIFNEKKVVSTRTWETLYKNGMRLEHLSEMKDIGAMIIIKNDLYRKSLMMASRHFFADLARRLKLGGTEMSNGNRKRNEYLMSCMSRSDRTNGKITVRRDDNGVTKIMAMTGPSYAYIPQSTIVHAIDNLEGLGEAKFRGYHVDNFETWAQVELPKISKDLADTYGLEEENCQPGLEFRTSDTGDSSLMAIPMVSINRGDMVPAESNVKRRHIGNIDGRDFIDRVRNECFGDYRKIPERLQQLALFPYQIPVRAGLVMGIKAMKLDGQFAKDSKLNELIDTICFEEGAATVSAFRMAEICVYAFQNDSISASCKEHMRSRSIKAIYADFESIAVRKPAEVASPVSEATEDMGISSDDSASYNETDMEDEYTSSALTGGDLASA